jgi:hypothetical protein
MTTNVTDVLVRQQDNRNQALVNFQALQILNSAREELSRRYSGLLRDGRRADALALVAEDGPSAKLKREIRYLNILNRIELKCATPEDTAQKSAIERQHKKEKFDLYDFVMSALGEEVAQKLCLILAADNPNAKKALTREEAERIAAEDEARAVKAVSK